MYIPDAFHVTDPAIIADFVRSHSFGTLVTHDDARGLFASHVPFLFREAAAGQRPVLISHLARQNQQWQSFREDAEVLVMFQGPHAYISPRWYQSKLAVPTWNYTAVHAYGRPSIVSDPAAVHAILSQITATYEPAGGWSPADQPGDFIEKLAAQIVAFTLSVTRLEAKFKLNQNRPLADRQSVIAQLEAAGDAESLAVAASMRRTLPEQASAPN